MSSSRPLPHITSPALAPSDEPLREDKFTTHDGNIWPVDRRLMQNPNTIRRRMAEDAEGIVRERGADATLSQDDLERLGWTRAQLQAHGNPVMRRVAEAIASGAQAAAFLIFCAGAFVLYAGVGGL